MNTVVCVVLMMAGCALAMSPVLPECVRLREALQADKDAGHNVAVPQCQDNGDFAYEQTGTRVIDGRLQPFSMCVIAHNGVEIEGTMLVGNEIAEGRKRIPCNACTVPVTNSRAPAKRSEDC